MCLPCTVQGHVVAEQQVKLTQQHYFDQLPQRSDSQPEYEEQAGPLTVNWHQENGRDSVTIQGMCTPALALCPCVNYLDVAFDVMLCVCVLEYSNATSSAL